MEEKGITVGIHHMNDTSQCQLPGESCAPRNKESGSGSQDAQDEEGGWAALCIITMSLLLVASVVIVHLARRAKEGKDVMAELAPLLEISSQGESRGSGLGSHSESGTSSSRRDSNISWESMKLTALDSESWAELMTKFGKKTSSLQIIDASELNIIRQVAIGGYDFCRMAVRPALFAFILLFFLSKIYKR